MPSMAQTSYRWDSRGLCFFDKILKPPTMNLPRRLAEVPQANQFPKIPFIPRSSPSRPLLPRRREVSHLLSAPCLLA